MYTASINTNMVCVCASVRACERACVRACVHVCVRACVRACVYQHMFLVMKRIQTERGRHALVSPVYQHFAVLNNYFGCRGIICNKKCHVCSISGYANTPLSVYTEANFVYPRQRDSVVLLMIISNIQRGVFEM